MRKFIVMASLALVLAYGSGNKGCGLGSADAAPPAAGGGFGAGGGFRGGPGFGGGGFGFRGGFGGGGGGGFGNSFARGIGFGAGANLGARITGGPFLGGGGFGAANRQNVTIINGQPVQAAPVQFFQAHPQTQTQIFRQQTIRTFGAATCP